MGRQAAPPDLLKAHHQYLAGDTYEYAQFYNFDLHSGSYFILQEAFTPDGLNRLSYQGCLRRTDR